MPKGRGQRKRFYRHRRGHGPHTGPGSGPASGASAHLRVALAGNPNAGKTSLFNALTGQHQHIGNYPGVTVEKKVGYIYGEDQVVEVVDLPGTYSLTAYSLEEVVARDFVLREKPDLIVDVLDSTNLERNLYLLLQFQELGVPVLGVLNMSDEAEEQGLRIDHEQLSTILGIPLIKTIGHRGVGVDTLKEMIFRIVKGETKVIDRRVNYGRELESQRRKLRDLLALDREFADRYSIDWIAIKLLEDDRDAAEKVQAEHNDPLIVLQAAQNARSWIRKHFNEDSSVVVAEQRYAYIHGAIRETVKRDQVRDRINLTEKLDKIALNRYGGLFVFFIAMFLVYQFTFTLGNPLSDLIDRGFGWLSGALSAALPAGILRDLLVDGIIGGVGGVLVFLPLVMFLFFGLAFLEDTGYMARAAFVMDRFFHLFGLHGRSFIPFMIATGCAVPAVMSARTLVNPRDRIITILVTPLLMCGAKAPVVAMLAAAFFPKSAALVFWLVWLMGWLIAFGIALLFRKTLFRGEAAPFVMELPPYRMPTVRAMVSHMWERAWLYLHKAGTIILAASVVVWFLLNFPMTESDAVAEEPGAASQTEMSEGRPASFVAPSSLVASARAGELTGHPDPTGDPAQAEPTASPQAAASDQSLDPAQERLLNSYAGRVGTALEGVLAPAGFDWKIAIALFSGVAAKEVIISTLAIVYNEVDAGEEATGLAVRQRITNDPAYSPAVALSLMFFVLIYMPCIATLGVVKRELGTWRWPLFMAVYTLLVAYGLSVAIYQASVLLGLG